MKKLLILTILVASVATLVGAQTSNTALVTSRGIGVTWRDTNTWNTDIKLGDQVTQGKAILDSDPATSGKNLFLVAQSMGGLRALGLAQAMQDNGVSRVKAVVTIGTPVRGHSALWNAGPQAMQGLKNNFIGIVRTLAQGKAEVEFKEGPIGWLPYSFVTSLEVVKTNQGFKDLNAVLQQDEAALLMGINSMGGVENPIFGILARGDAPVAIQDMVPRSDFIATHIAKETDVTDTYQTLDYWQVVWTWHWEWWGGYPTASMYPVYKTYTVSSVKTEGRIPASTKLLNIVGTQNDPNYIEKNLEKRAEQIKQNQDLARRLQESADWYRNLNTTYTTAGYALRATLFNWDNGTAMLNLANEMWDRKNHCEDARSYLVDPTKITRVAYGSSANDGFIPYNDQYRLDMGGTPIYGSNANTDQVREVNLSHSEQLDSSLLYGQGTNGVNADSNQGLSPGQGLYDDNLPIDQKPLVLKALYQYHALNRDKVREMGDPSNNLWIKNAHAF